MTSVCTTEKEFANAVKNNEDTIIVEGDLVKGIVRIKAIGKVAWGVCAASLAVAITICITTIPTLIAAPPAVTLQFVASIPAAAVAAATLGTAVVPAVLIGVSAGGIGVLTNLRDKYKIVDKTDKRLTLKRK